MTGAAYDDAKFTELVLHAAQLLVGDPSGGAVKLNKLLYFAETEHYRRTGRTITGVEFQKLPHGPAPRAMLDVRSRLAAAGRARLQSSVTDGGHRLDALVPLAEPDLSLFDESERHTIATVADQLRTMTATEVSELSHRQAGWQLVDVGETIPHCAALLDEEATVPDRLRPVVAVRARELSERHGGDASG
ncbi:MAG: Panacea domain-containing protein [Actinomycetota bacterium]